MNWKTILRFKAIGVVLVLAIMMIPVGYVAAREMDCNFPVLPGLNGDIADVIKTDKGYVSGSKIDAISFPGPTTLQTELFGPPALPGMIGQIGYVVRVFRGIPYAAPPVGNLRWKPPQPATAWEGIRECTVFSPMAPQLYPSVALYGSIPESGMSEDCLYLNVVTPAQTSFDGLPVMVWFHGGGITEGSSNPATTNSPPLPQQGVVLVTVQHRIGPLGYMCHPALAAESGNLCGNYGQLDLIAALQWVQRNIAAFGGDPYNVTIFGQSGGGAKVNGLMASPLAKGLFQRAISQAAGGASGTPLATAEQNGVALAAYFGISDTGATGLADLRGIAWESIINAGDASPAPGGYVNDFTIDGYYLQDTVLNIFQEGKQEDVPYLTGMAGEDITFIYQSTQTLVSTMKTGKSKVYVYLFDHVPTGWKTEGIFHAFHGLEVAYEFGFQPWVASFWGTLFFPFSSYCGISVPQNPGLDSKDTYVAEAMMAMWARFAATGNPSVYSLVQWPAYNPVTDQYLFIDDPLQVQSGFSKLVEPTLDHCGL
jgi:para-nitrobenzyl esterase